MEALSDIGTGDKSHEFLVVTHLIHAEALTMSALRSTLIGRSFLEMVLHQCPEISARRTLSGTPRAVPFSSADARSKRSGARMPPSLRRHAGRSPTSLR